LLKKSYKMKVSVEISMYPFIENYTTPINLFLDKLKTNKELIVNINAMSTEIYGEYDVIMQVLEDLIGDEFETIKAVFSLKISNAC